MADTVKSWIEERRAIHRNRHVKRSAWSEATRDWAVEFPRALDALEDLIGIAHLMDEEAREYEHEGRVLAAQIARGHAASIRSAIESALEDGND